MFRYRIIIRAFTLRRDAAASMLFAALLRKQGADVIITSGRDFQRTVRHWNPDAIIVNTVGQIERLMRQMLQNGLSSIIFFQIFWETFVRFRVKKPVVLHAV